MKKLLLLLAILGTIPTFAQKIKQGDNLKTEFEKMTNRFYFSAPKFTDWLEGANMLLISSKPNPNDCDFVFIALQDSTLIGVFTTKSPNVFMFDTENNSILNITSDLFLLPLWTVKNKAKITSSDKAIIELLDLMYEQTLQANDLNLEEKTIKQYEQYKTDTTLANRHIALLFDNYHTTITETAADEVNIAAELSISLMKSLSGECLSLYKSIPVIVSVYMGEALESAGMTDKAREHFKLSLQFYPNSIPLQVYNYRLEQDQTKKKNQLAELKKNYPKHWMVKDL